MNELNNKKGSISTVIIVILLAVIIGLGFYIACDKGLIFDNNNNEQIDNENSNDKIPVGETKLTDSEIIDTLSKTIEVINSGELGCYPPIIENLYTDDVYNSSISIQDKLLLAINASHEKSTVFDDAFEGGAPSRKVSQEVVEEQFYKIFGKTETINHQSFETFCPSIIYDESSKEYYYRSACGGGCGLDIIGYNLSYNYEDDKYYVYQALGIIEYKYNENAYDTDVILYADIEKTKIYQANMSNNFEINESNYQDFSMYKWTFIKNAEGHYIFDSIKRVK